jgi:fibronectin type 3 domain-containing protein
MNKKNLYFIFLFVSTLLNSVEIVELSRLYSEIKSASNSIHLNRELSSLEIDDLFNLALMFNSNTEQELLAYSVGVELVKRSKNDSDFEIILDRLNSEQNLKPFILWILNSAYNKYSSKMKKEIYISSYGLLHQNKLKNIDSKIYALLLSNKALGDLYINNEVNLDTVEDYFNNIIKPIIHNKSKHPEVRRCAIKSIRNLDYTPFRQNLLEIISKEDNEQVLKALSSILGHFKSTEAIPYLKRIATNTNNEYLFAVATNALGKIGTYKCLEILLDNDDRFEGDYIGVAIRIMDKFVIELLKSDDKEKLILAVKATKHFYKGYRGNYAEKDYVGEAINTKKYLIDILDKSRDPFILSLVNDRLKEIISTEEVSNITNNIRSKLPDNYIRLFSNAIPQKINSSEIRTDEQPRNNTETQEYADPGYRRLGFSWDGLGNLGHTGLCAGINSSNTIKIIEVGGTSNVVRHNNWSSMQDDSDYWGAYTLNNTSSMTFSKRRDIMDTAVNLIGEDIGYPVLPTPDALRHISNPGTYVNTSEITDLRCDGLIEYCYEWRNEWVWGKNGNNYDISRASNVDDHNNFYDWPYNPNTELAPNVQCGREGGASTHMTWASVTDTPEYEASATLNGSQITVFLTATDQSGIHYIKYKIGPNASYISSPILAQHPTSDTYTFSFTVNLNDLNTIYFYAKDNGGNYPEYATALEIEIDAPENINATDGDYEDKVRISWDNLTSSSYFKVYRSSSPNGSYYSVSNWQLSNSYDDYSINPGETYYYKVKAAINNVGDYSSEFSNYDSGWCCLSNPNNINATDGVYTSHINITWDNVSGGSYYNLYRCNSPYGTYQAINNWQMNNSYNDYSVDAGVEYYYKVKAATNSNGNNASEFSNYDSGWCILNAPTNVNASDGTYNDRIEITWSNVENASYYAVYRHTNNNHANAQLLGNWQTSSSYTDFNVQTDVTYYYWLKSSANSSGNNPSPFSNYDSGSLNSIPNITDQNYLSTHEDTPIIISLSDLIVVDSNNNYPNGFSLTIYGGNNYSINDNTVVPNTNFNGELSVPVSVNDNINRVESNIFNLSITVIPINDVPEIIDQSQLTTNEDNLLIISFNDLIVIDPDNNYPEDFTLNIFNGDNYTINGNSILPDADFYGNLIIPITVNDGMNNLRNNRCKNREVSNTFNLNVEVLPINDSPEIIEYFPLDSQIDVFTDENILFRCVAEDIDSEINYSWYVDSENQLNTSDSLNISFSNSGNFHITCLISDNEYQLEKNWEVSVSISNPITENIIPSSNQLIGNFPNPFNPKTTIQYSLCKNSFIEIDIFNIKGQKVNSLVNAMQSSGKKSVIWDGTDFNNNQLTSGIYFYSLIIDKKEYCLKKCILLK